MRPRPWGQEGLLAFPSQVHIRSFLLRRGKRSLHFLPTLLFLPSPTLALSSVFQRRWRLTKRPRSSCDRSSLLIPRVTCRDMDILSCLRAWRRGLSVLKARGEDQTSLFEGCGELHPFFLSICSLPFFEQVEEVVRISFPYLERKEVSSSRLRGRRSSLSFS